MASRNEIKTNRKTKSFLTSTESFSYIEGEIFMRIVLSKRLESIASFIPRGARFADIGSDHAYLPCAVCIKDPTARAIAGEVRSGPFQSAQKTVKENELEEQVDVRLGDGLDVMDKCISHVIIAGMGGALIESILERGKNKLMNVQGMILQPNIGSSNVRRWIDSHAFAIIHEEIIEENDHFYEVIVAKRVDVQWQIKQLTEKEIYLGPLLTPERSSLFMKKWTREQRHLEHIVEQMKQSKHPNAAQLNQFMKQIGWIKEEVNGG